jgi:hypothetical protein
MMVDSRKRGIGGDGVGMCALVGRSMISIFDTGNRRRGGFCLVRNERELPSPIETRLDHQQRTSMSDIRNSYRTTRPRTRNAFGRQEPSSQSRSTALSSACRRLHHRSPRTMVSLLGTSSMPRFWTVDRRPRDGRKQQNDRCFRLSYFLQHQKCTRFGPPPFGHAKQYQTKRRDVAKSPNWTWWSNGKKAVALAPWSNRRKKSRRLCCRAGAPSPG